MKPKRETAEQRARRIGRGLGFWLEPTGDDRNTFMYCYLNGLGHKAGRVATLSEIALWRALERSQRALARERGIKP